MLDMMRNEMDILAQDTYVWKRAKPASLFSAKRTFDICVSLLLLVPLVAIAICLVPLNRLFNRGPLLFVQDRMGFHCNAFRAVKFRTMTVPAGHGRGAFDKLETDRITPLGHLLRRTRIDELPQILNVLRGEMSLIGPRPDSYDHARIYLAQVAGYWARHDVMPGISGYAQTQIGYVDGIAGVRDKVAADLYYIANATFRFDLWIAMRTVVVVLGLRGR